MARIDGIRSKIKRAENHIANLEVAIRSFCDSEPYTIAAKPHRVPEIEHTTLYIASVNPVPDEIPLTLGDAVHNLRSTLDHLAWQLVEAGGGVPNRDTYFPICIDPNGSQKYTSAIGKGEISNMRPGADKVLQAIQPYVTGDDTLWHIHELDRVDKHRLLITAVVAMRAWGVNPFGRGETLWFDGGSYFPLEQDYAIVNIPTPTYMKQKPQDFKLGLNIEFGQFEIVKGRSVLETLKGMVKFVDGVLNTLEPFLL